MNTIRRIHVVVLTLIGALVACPAGRAAGPVVSSDVCFPCHVSNGVAFLYEGKDVSPISTWEPAMMAMAARDPYWRAKMSAEVAGRPDLKETIESE